jgi:hypothetical protein
MDARPIHDTTEDEEEPVNSLRGRRLVGVVAWLGWAVCTQGGESISVDGASLLAEEVERSDAKHAWLREQTGPETFTVLHLIDCHIFEPLGDQMNEPNQIAPHHQRAIEKITGKFQSDPQVVALLLAGSIVKGVQKDNSDVDVIVILPANFRALLDAFLVAPTNDNMRAFTKCITEFRDWGIGKDYSVPLTRYQHDHEQWWYLHRPYIAEW